MGSILRRGSRTGRVSRRTLGCVLAAGALAAAAPAVAGATSPQADRRAPSVATGQAPAKVAPVPRATTRARRRLLDRLGRGGVLAVDPATGNARQIVRLDGALGAPHGGSRAAIVQRWARANAGALGLDANDLSALGPAASATTSGGLTRVRFEQRYRGIPAFGSTLTAALDRAGRVISVGGSPEPDLAVRSIVPRVSAARAINAVGAAPGAKQGAQRAATRLTRFADGSFAKLVIDTGSGTPRLAWSVLARGASGSWHGIVDARSGRILLRASLTDAAAPARVFPHYPGAPGAQNAPRDVDLETLGYLPPNAGTLSGRFAHTYDDVNATFSAQSAEEVRRNAGGNFIYPFQLSGSGPFQVPTHGCLAAKPCSWNHELGGSWKTNRQQTAVQLHYYLGHFHDHLLAPPIGFTNAWGNFEAGGSGGSDPIQALADFAAFTGPDGNPDPESTNNAFFETLPDGIPPNLAAFLNEALPEPGRPHGSLRDSSMADIASVIYHEYTHGLSNRLITYPDGFGALNAFQSGSMGEAWSDWYALDLLAREGNMPDAIGTPGQMDLGAYTDVVPNALRTQPLDCPVGNSAGLCVGGYTFGDLTKVIGFPEVHADGEIWGETLWDLRQALIQKLGSEAAGSNAAERLITDGMRLAPPDPSMIDARNAIFAAERAAFGGAQADVLWTVFARRGFGFFASTLHGDDLDPVESFVKPPPANVARGTLRGKVTDAQTGAPLRGTRVVGAPVGGLETTTAANGTYSLSLPALTYPGVLYDRPGYEVVRRKVTIASGKITTLDIALARNWASAAGGGRATSTDENYADIGCGSAGLIDQGALGWSADNDGSASTGPVATITLPGRVDISSLRVDPAANCGDDTTSALRAYRIETSKDRVHWTLAAQGSFPASAGGKNNNVPLAAAAKQGVRAVRLTLLSPQNDRCGENCSGTFYVDASELQVFGAPAQ